jgi:Raf kinase inhibitor-like YbhB/YbcL family protein
MEPLRVNPGFSIFPTRHTCDGVNVSPRIEIGGLQTPCAALILEDMDALGGVFTHWLVWNITPPGIVPEGLPAEERVSYPIAAMQGINDFGGIGFSGPCPPREESHRYIFRAYGLAEIIDLPPGAGRIDVERGMEDVIRQYGEAMAAYGRKAEARHLR